MAQTVSTGQIIDDVAQRAGLSKAEAKKVVQALSDVLGERLSIGARIQITGLGSFDVRDRAAREATNPRTKEKMEVAATKVVGFRPATVLRERVGGEAS